MEPAAAKFLMALIILTRSSAFLFSKFVLEELAPFQALGFRFTLAFLVMGLLLRRHLLRAWKKDAYLGPKSLGLGLLLFAVMGAEMRSLLTAEIHTVAFLENLSLALVPLFLALWYRRLPSARILQGVGFILLGVAALTIGTVGFTLAGGEGWALLAAVFYAGYIIAMGKLSHTSDPLSLGTLHMGFMGLLSFGAALILEGGIPFAPSFPDLAVPSLPGAGMQLLRVCLPAQGPAVPDSRRSRSVLCHQSPVCQLSGTLVPGRDLGRCRDPGSGVYPHWAGIRELEGSVTRATDLSAVSCQRSTAADH